MIFRAMKHTSNDGFTIMEAMVTMAIIAIMLAVYLTNYRPTNQKIILDQAIAGLVTDLRLAQNMALNVELFNGEIPLGGYGININSATSYIIYADCDNDHNYDIASSCASGTTTEKYINRDLSSNVNIIVSSSLANITFVPPFATVYVDGAAPAAGSATIALRYGGAGDPTRTISVNRITGQINAN